MAHLVYCENQGKKGERVLDKIFSGTKTMVVRGAAGRKILIAEYLKTKLFILWRKEPVKSLHMPL